jgi:hypothetical protein
MSRNLSYEQLVERYLENEMSQIEQLEFENQLIQNPVLKEEYNFQKELIEGVKESRRLELKARLDGIPIHTPFYQTLGFKSIIAATITAGIGFGLYSLIDRSNDIPASKVDITQDQVLLDHTNEIPEIPETIIPLEKSTTESIATPEIATKSGIQSPREKVVAEERKVVEPVVIAPEVVDVFDEADFESEEINVNSQIDRLEKVKEDVESAVEVTTIKDKRNKFHYKFYENKLYLLGSFNEMPYEILELHSKTGKSYFLYYNESFYKLQTDQIKPAPLVKIENDSLVNELRIIQMNHK